MLAANNTSPINFNIISWGDTAKNIKKLLMLKNSYFVINNQCFIASRFKISKCRSKTPYGTVVSLDRNQLIIIATLTYDIVITKIRDIADNAYSLTKLKNYFHITAGDRVKSFSATEYVAIARFEAKIQNNTEIVAGHA